MHFGLTTPKANNTTYGMRQQMALIASTFFLLVTAPAPAQEHSTAKGTISQPEREALIALYKSTSGDHWKTHEKWLGPPGTECNWYGVTCAGGTSGKVTVKGIQLSENNLTGKIPSQLDQLTGLDSLDLAGNPLAGPIPEALIRLWLSGSLWLAAEDALLTDVSEIDFEANPSSVLCGRARLVLRVSGSVSYFSQRCRNSGPNERTTFCEVKRGQLWPRYFGKLAWTLNINGFYRLRSQYERTVTDGTFESTRVVKSGKKYQVVNYADAGPFELWEIQRAIQSTVADAEWIKTELHPECPRWNQGEITEETKK